MEATWRDGALVSVRTEPRAPCVEQRATSALADVPSIFTAWDSISCGLEIPLQTDAP